MNNSINDYNNSYNLYEKGWRELKLELSGSSIFEGLGFPIGKRRIPIRSFNSNTISIECNKPVEMIIYYDDDCFIAENENLHIFATGETSDEATSSFISQVIHFYQYYVSVQQNEITDDALELKNLYDTFFYLPMVDVA